ncbi:unnamed protein product [Calypogeia fissa]
MVVFKNRYLLMEILWFGTPLAESSSILTPSVVSAAIQESLVLTFGDHGLGSSLPSLQVKYVNPITSLCLIRCSRQEYQKVWCAISYATSLRKHPVVFNLLDLSGNIKSSQKIIPKCEAEKLKHLKLKLGASLTSAQLEAANSITQRALSIEG